VRCPEADHMVACWYDQMQNHIKILMFVDSPLAAFATNIGFSSGFCGSCVFIRLIRAARNDILRLRELRCNHTILPRSLFIGRMRHTQTDIMILIPSSGTLHRRLRHRDEVLLRHFVKIVTGVRLGLPDSRHDLASL